MRILITLYIIYFSFWAITQDSLKLILENEIKFNSEINWDVDNLGNLIVAEKDKLVKFDTKGGKMFEQSIKKYGQISKIDARNPMKILFFSEEQQSIFFTDNTLTKHNSSIDLSNFDFSYVSQVSSSKLQDRIWVYDQDNSKVNLISTNTAQNQQIENLSGILGFSKINQFFESNDYLWIIDTTKGVYQFDIYGTLIAHLDYVAFNFYDVDEKYFYYLKENNLIVKSKNNAILKEISLPINEINKFEIQGNYIFLESNSTIFIFKLEIF